MSRLRLGGLITFTLVTLVLTGLAVADAVKDAHGRQGASASDSVFMLTSYLMVAVMLAATGGFWFQWLLRRRRNAIAVPPMAGSKYAAWGSTRLRAVKPMKPDAASAIKPVHRKR